MPNRKEVKGPEVFIYDDSDKLIGYGGVTKVSPLSNFYNSSFEYENITWPFAEAAIMWTKAQCFNDEEIAKLLLNVKTPGAAKKLGRKVKGFDPKKWIECRNEKVPQILFAKFSTSELKEWLLGTGNAKLAEIAIENRTTKRISYSDRIWGVKLGPSSKEILNPDEWDKFGENFCGKTVMKVRERLRNEVD